MERLMEECRDGDSYLEELDSEELELEKKIKKRVSKMKKDLRFVRFDLVYPITLTFSKEEFEKKIGNWEELLKETVNLDILDKIKEYASHRITKLKSIELELDLELEFAEVTEEGKKIELTELEER